MARMTSRCFGAGMPGLSAFARPFAFIVMTVVDVLVRFFSLLADELAALSVAWKQHMGPCGQAGSIKRPKGGGANKTGV